MPRAFTVEPIRAGGNQVCRDTYITRLRYYEQYGLGKVSSEGLANWSIAINTDSRCGDHSGWHYHDYTDYLNILWRGVAGETNADFPPLQSPFAMRWLIDKGRRAAGQNDRSRFEGLPDPNDLAACRRYARRFCRDWFAKLMIQADKKGISLNPDLKESWQYGNRNAGSMGLSSLKGLKNNKLQYRVDLIVAAFPPAQLLL